MAEGGGLRGGSPAVGLFVFTVVLAAAGGGLCLSDLWLRCGTWFCVEGVSDAVLVLDLVCWCSGLVSPELVCW
jgi:hypothetical protein